MKSKMTDMYFALCQNLKLYLVNLNLKTLQTSKNGFSSTYKVFNAKNLCKISKMLQFISYKLMRGLNIEPALPDETGFAQL